MEKDMHNRGALSRVVRGVLVGMLVLSLLAVSLGCSGGKPAEKPAEKGAEAKKEPVKIGAIYPLSGPMALLGEESFRGAELARIERNKKGGINGREIQFVKADAPDTNAAKSEAERLVTKENLKVILGTYSSSLSYAATEVAERNKVVYFELGAISDPITERGFKYTFRTCAPASAFGKIGVRVIAEMVAPKLNIDPKQIKLALVHEDSLYGTTCAKYAKAEAEKIGMPVVAVEPYNSKANDLSPVILKLKAANPDAVIATSYIADAILFSKQAKELDFNVKAFVGQGGGHSMSDWAKAVGDVSGFLNVDFPQYQIDKSYTPGLDEFVQLYKDTYKEPPHSGHSLVNYYGAKVLFDVLEKAGELDPDKIRQAALSLDVAEGTTVTGWGVKFDPNTGQNVRALPYGLMWNENQEQVTIYPEKAAVAEIKVPLPKWSERKK